MFTSSEHSSELLRSVLRYVAWAMVGMGVFTLLSGGVNVISSCLVLAMGSQWLSAAASRGSLVTHLDELSLLRDKDCRGCCRNCCSGMCRGVFDNIRGLAIAAIVFGVFELLAYVVAFSLLGFLFTTDSYYSSGNYGGTYSVQSTRQFSCYAGGSQYCTISYYPSFLYQSYSFQCYAGGSNFCYATLPDTLYSSSYYYNDFGYSYINSVGRWLFYAVGHTAVAAPLNIAWGALTLNLIGALTILANGSSAGESTALLYKAAAPVFMVGKEKQPETSA